ncbi:uncharacterized protein LOC115899696 [Rhinopithecus roxellana]|uniref:uncharacterized protein LOC115899696 n=1 Tax=Rhinopithecus roxellana TaxID=61622 RepID=UPI00123793F0|nr:uncharacterized protein LOC115899696 [Rhinopithecus roxellana]
MPPLLSTTPPPVILWWHLTPNASSIPSRLLPVPGSILSPFKPKGSFARRQPALQEQKAWTSTVFTTISAPGRGGPILPLDRLWKDPEKTLEVFTGYFSVPHGVGKSAGAATGEEGVARLRTTRTWPAGIPEGGPQVAARGGGRGREGGGLGARRAVTAARRGGASRPLAGEPWREAAPRRPHQCPRPQQRPCPPPRGPPGRRPRSPRDFDARAPRARRPLARGRARESPSAALASPRVSNAPTTPASPNPGLRAQERQGGRRAVGGGGAGAEPPRVPPCRPAGCSGGNRSSRAAGVGPTTTRRKPPPRPLGTAPAAGLRSAPLLRDFKNKNLV